MQPPSPPRQQRRRGCASRLPLFLLLLLGCLAPSSLAFLLHPQQPQPPSTPTPARARRAPIAAATGAQAAADSAAAVEGAAGVEKGLVVLTREEGKNDKLRGRLEALQVGVVRARVCYILMCVGCGRCMGWDATAPRPTYSRGNTYNDNGRSR